MTSFSAWVRSPEVMAWLSSDFRHPLVDAGVVVVALCEGDGAELHEVLIALVVLGEDGEVAVLLLRVAPVETGALGEVHLAADDGLEPHGLGVRVELDGAVHRAVVGDRDMAHLKFTRLGHIVVDPPEAIEQRVLGVQMQVDERRHQDLQITD